MEIKLFKEVRSSCRTIINLASKEYSKVVEKCLKPEEIKGFDRLGYSYRNDLSSYTDYVFERVSAILD